jgi:ADP-heptose:LPS heptosyltransferase
VDFAGRRFFLLAEQGIGDELFFLRFVPEIRRRGGWVAYAASPKLMPLLARSAELDCVVASGDCVAAADYTFLATEAPLVLGMQDDDPLPPPLPLAPLPERLAQMRERLAALGPGPCLGVTWWAGTPPDAAAGKRKASYRAVPLEQVAAALKSWPGPVLVLQRNPKADEMAALSQALGREVHDFSAANDDLEEMLALLALLDEYVGVDNTNMYLGAGLGKPCRALLTSLPDWRWGADGESTPWFPGFRQYRQGPDGGWNEALARLTQDLSRSDR